MFHKALKVASVIVLVVFMFITIYLAVVVLQNATTNFFGYSSVNNGMVILGLVILVVGSTVSFATFSLLGTIADIGADTQRNKEVLQHMDYVITEIANQKLSTPVIQLQQAAPFSIPAAAPMPMMQGGSAMPIGGRPMIRSLSAEHMGVELPIGNAPLLIGRDASACQLIFRDPASGVSSRHCSVAYDAMSGDFLVTDLGSSFGTFLMSGQRIIAHSPSHLKSGERFYVGDPANVIELKRG